MMELTLNTQAPSRKRPTRRWCSPSVSSLAQHSLTGNLVIIISTLPEPCFQACAPPEPAVFMATVLGDNDGPVVVRIVEHGVHLRVFDAPFLHGAVGTSPNKGTPIAWDAFDPDGKD